MALLENARGRKDWKNSGYSRLLGNPVLGRLISRVQGASITAGRELERIIAGRVKSISDLDDFLSRELMPDGVFLVAKKQVKHYRKLKFPGTDPDFIIFKRRDKKQHCYVVELKDGDTFDTKKAAGEYESMCKFLSHISQRIGYEVSCYFVAFNQDSKEEIHKGFKKKIPLEKCMTGREFCKLLEIDYDDIVASRKKDASKNFPYFIQELLRIDEVREVMRKHFADLKNE